MTSLTSLHPHCPETALPPSLECIRVLLSSRDSGGCHLRVHDFIIYALLTIIWFTLQWSHDYYQFFSGLPSCQFSLFLNTVIVINCTPTSKNGQVCGDMFQPWNLTTICCFQIFHNSVTYFSPQFTGGPLDWWRKQNVLEIYPPSFWLMSQVLTSLSVWSQHGEC